MKSMLVFVLVAAALAAAQQKPAQKSEKRMPVVFIAGNESVTTSGGGVAIGPVASSSTTVSKHEERIAIAQDLLKYCPEITFTLQSDNPRPDYALLFDRNSEGLFSDPSSQILLVNGSDKVVLWASKKSSSAKAARAACQAIRENWLRRNSQSMIDDHWQPAAGSSAESGAAPRSTQSQPAK
jgi:hypothetical protein